MKVVSICFLVVLLSACASVKVYDKDGVNSGVKFYSAKPYLLVTRTGNKENPVSVDIISLPDLDSPQYAKFKPGYGSSELSLKLSNGILSEYGGKGESGDVAEILNAITGGYKTIAEVAKINIETRQAQQNGNGVVNQSVSSMEFGTAAKSFVNLASSIEDGVSEAKRAGIIDAAHLISSTGKDVVSELRVSSKLFSDAAGKLEELELLRKPTLLKLESMLLDLTEGDMVFSTPSTDDQNKYEGKRKGWRDKLAGVIEILTPEPQAVSPQPTFELYEIVSSADKSATPVFRKVIPKVSSVDKPAPPVSKKVDGKK